MTLGNRRNPSPDGLLPLAGPNCGILEEGLAAGWWADCGTSAANSPIKPVLTVLHGDGKRIGPTARHLPRLRAKCAPAVCSLSLW